VQRCQQPKIAQTFWASIPHPILRLNPHPQRPQSSTPENPTLAKGSDSRSSTGRGRAGGWNDSTTTAALLAFHDLDSGSCIAKNWPQPKNGRLWLGNMIRLSRDDRKVAVLEEGSSDDFFMQVGWGRLSQVAYTKYRDLSPDSGLGWRKLWWPCDLSRVDFRWVAFGWQVFFGLLPYEAAFSMVGFGWFLGLNYTQSIIIRAKPSPIH